MTVWLILDNTQTVINVFDDYLGAWKLQPGQTQIELDKSNMGIGPGHRLTPDGDWLSPEQIASENPIGTILDQIKALPADKQNEILMALSAIAEVKP